MGKKADEYIASRVNSVIGRGTEFEGTIRTKETIRVEGFVKGNIISEGTVIIGNGGNVDGKIEANSSGRIFGNLHTKGLIVDEKALFQGTCEMTGREESKAEKEAPKETEEAKETA